MNKRRELTRIGNENLFCIWYLVLSIKYKERADILGLLKTSFWRKPESFLFSKTTLILNQVQDDKLSQNNRLPYELPVTSY